MFKIGSYVAYRSEGVCVISDIRAETFGAPNNSELYYILTPVRHTQSTLFVPVKNENLTSQMRTLLSADEINQLAAEIRGQKLSLPAESRARNNLFKEILSRGDRAELAVLALSLSEKIDEILARGKKPGTTETNAFHRATRMLYEEFEITTNISSAEQIVEFLKGNVTLGEKA